MLSLLSEVQAREPSRRTPVGLRPMASTFTSPVSHTVTVTCFAETRMARSPSWPECDRPIVFWPSASGHSLEAPLSTNVKLVMTTSGGCAQGPTQTITGPDSND